MVEAPGGAGDLYGTQTELNDAARTSGASGTERTDVATSLWPLVSGPKSSDSLSREKFLSDILWRGGGDEVDEVFSIENLETEQYFRRHQQQEAAPTASGEVKVSAPRVFHQRSKSNIESSSKGGPGTARPELTREFGSDESLLASPKKVSTLHLSFPSSFTSANHPLSHHSFYQNLTSNVQVVLLTSLTTKPFLNPQNLSSCYVLAQIITFVHLSLSRHHSTHPSSCQNLP